jgi:hypothetical protein
MGRRSGLSESWLVCVERTTLLLLQRERHDWVGDTRDTHSKGSKQQIRLAPSLGQHHRTLFSFHY